MFLFFREFGLGILGSWYEVFVLGRLVGGLSIDFCRVWWVYLFRY